MPLCWPSFVTMMNWPLSISSLTTSSGLTPNFSAIIFRAETGLTDPPQLRPIMRTLSRLTWLRLASSYRPIASQPFTGTAIRIFSAPSRYFLTSFESRSVPQWREPAVCAISAGSVMSVGTASYRSCPFLTARTASTMPDLSACVSRAVTAPPHSPFSWQAASAAQA